MSFITGKQVQILQIARRQVERISQGAFDEDAYQLALRNCGVKPDAGQGGRCSSKQLTQAGFERFMSLMEDMGFRDASDDDQHWRRRNSQRTGYATSRQVHEIRKLAPLQKYNLQSLCQRASNNQHTTPEQLTVAQAAKLIEGLKAITSRRQDEGVPA